MLESIIFVVSYYVGIFFYFGTDIKSNLSFDIKPFLYSSIMILSISTQGLYRVRYRESYLGIFVRIFISFVVGFLIIIFLFYISSLSMFYFGRLAFAYSHITSFICICIVHAYFFAAIDQSKFKNRIFVLGTGYKASSLSQLRRKSDLRNCVIVGYIKCTPNNLCVANDIVDINIEDLKSYAINNNVNEILAAFDNHHISPFIEQQLIGCRMNGINVIDLCSFFERETGRIKLDLLHPSWLIYSDGFDQNTNRIFLKRMIDLFLSILLIFLSLPVMFFAALAIFIDSNRGEGIFYQQGRIGLNGKPFKIIKFRSMIANAESNNGAQWAQEDDKRITRVGKFIRKYRIDELPQLFNVFMGNMSLVGPRPERPEFVAMLSERIPYYNERHRVKPGITGWAQLNYPYGASIQDSLEKLQYDLYFVKNNSLFLDTMILLQTAEIILFKKGSR